MGEGTPVDLGIDGIEEAVAIGTGASATVYRARQPRLGRTVAVKVINTAGEEDTLRRFAREALALGSLSEHPGIVTVYEVGSTHAGHPYLTMQYCAGGSIRERLRDSGPYEPDEARVLVAAVARTVATAHAQGITHRDLKPANILIGNDGRPLVADFGIAALANVTAGVTAATAFTPSYAPPEVLKGEAPGEPGDVYSLGASLFHMLLGRVPFASTDGSSVGLVALARRIDTENIADLRRHGVPDRLAAAVEAAMLKEPMRRPSMIEFAAMLDAAADDGFPDEPPTVRAPHATPIVAPTPPNPPLPPRTASSTPNDHGNRPADGGWWHDAPPSGDPGDAGGAWWADDGPSARGDLPSTSPEPSFTPLPRPSSAPSAPSTVSFSEPSVLRASHRPEPAPVGPSRQTRTALIVIVLAMAAITTIAMAMVLGSGDEDASGSTTTAAASATALATVTPRPTLVATPTAVATSTPLPTPTAAPEPTATPAPTPRPVAAAPPSPPNRCPRGQSRQDGPSLTIVPDQVRRGGEREFRVCGGGWSATPPVFVLPCFRASTPAAIAEAGAAACDTAALTPTTPADGAFRVMVTYDVPRRGMCIAAGDAAQTESAFACIRVRRNN
jgi:serine/threonine-protein kinase PknK